LGRHDETTKLFEYKTNCVVRLCLVLKWVRPRSQPIESLDSPPHVNHCIVEGRKVDENARTFIAQFWFDKTSIYTGNSRCDRKRCAVWMIGSRKWSSCIGLHAVPVMCATYGHSSSRPCLLIVWRYFRRISIWDSYLILWRGRWLNAAIDLPRASFRLSIDRTQRHKRPAGVFGRCP
jgi:hypothetical protein